MPRIGNFFDCFRMNLISEKEKIQKIVIAACSSTESEIGKDYFREIKKFLLMTQDFELLFEIIIKQLKKEEAQIRFLAWQILAYLFPRSNKIR